MSAAELRVVGIDLGTTYSCVAHMEVGRPVVIPNFEGKYTTPSVVFFHGDTRTVGEEAKNNAVLHPDQVVALVKRQMGSADWRFPHGEANITPEEISSYILRKLIGDAEQYLGYPVKDVVITCPAYFGTAEREATKTAGEIAGLNVLSIVNEPTAAAIAYGLLEGGDKIIMVYDLGGGTFDITLIEFKGATITAIATGGDHHLGGRQWDEVVVNYLAAQWMTETGSSEDPTDSPETLQDLFAKAEAGKLALASPRGYTDIAVSHNGRPVGVRLTREKFDELTAHLLERTINYTRHMLVQAAAKGYTRFDEILLVGGSTKMLQVRERVEQEFKIKPKSADPDQAVAKGAAIYAYKMSLDRLFEEGLVKRDDPDIVLPSIRPIVDVKIIIATSRSFGVVALQRRDGREVERVSNLIKVNTSLPVQVSKMFGTHEANQVQVDIHYVENLLQDDDVDPADCEEIGTAMLALPPNLPAGSPIEITFQLDEQGLLHTTARDMTTNRVVEVTIKTERAISAEEKAEAQERSRRVTIL